VAPARFSSAPIILHLLGGTGSAIARPDLSPVPSTTSQMTTSPQAA
jgi:hypothetical protein